MTSEGAFRKKLPRSSKRAKIPFPARLAGRVYVDVIVEQNDV